MTNSEAVSMLMNNQYYNQGYKQGVSDILNSIRAEIENEQNPYLSIKVCGGFAGGYYDGLAKALKIINRHINGEGSD